MLKKIHAGLFALSFVSDVSATMGDLEGFTPDNVRSVGVELEWKDFTSFELVSKGIFRALQGDPRYSGFLGANKKIASELQDEASLEEHISIRIFQVGGKKKFLEKFKGSRKGWTARQTYDLLRTYIYHAPSRDEGGSNHFCRSSLKDSFDFNTGIECSIPEARVTYKKLSEDNNDHLATFRYAELLLRGIPGDDLEPLEQIQSAFRIIDTLSEFGENLRLPEDEKERLDVCRARRYACDQNATLGQLEEAVETFKISGMSVLNYGYSAVAKYRLSDSRDLCIMSIPYIAPYPINIRDQINFYKGMIYLGDMATSSRGRTKMRQNATSAYWHLSEITSESPYLKRFQNLELIFGEAQLTTYEERENSEFLKDTLITYQTFVDQYPPGHTVHKSARRIVDLAEFFLGLLDQ
ncbi:MAG: hypothetical protein GY915_08425 [bacterium]|nr:hypothetical protein [bacterium]